MFDDDLEELIDGEKDEAEGLFDEGDEGLAEGEDEQEVDDFEASDGAKEAGRDADLAAGRKPASRGDRDYAAMRRRTQEAEREARDAREERDRLKQEQQRRQHVETEAEERARLELMPADERHAYLIDKQARTFAGQMQGLEMRSADRSDRSEFRHLCALDSPKGRALASVADEVEKRAKQHMAEGRVVEREVIAKYLLGEKLLERAPKQAKRQRAAAGERVRGQTVRAPASGRSDAGGQGKRTEKTAAERLDGVQI